METYRKQSGRILFLVGVATSSLAVTTAAAQATRVAPLCDTLGVTEGHVGLAERRAAIEQAPRCGPRGVAALIKWWTVAVPTEPALLLSLPEATGSVGDASVAMAVRKVLTSTQYSEMQRVAALKTVVIYLDPTWRVYVSGVDGATVPRGQLIFWASRTDVQPSGGRRRAPVADSQRRRILEDLRSVAEQETTTRFGDIVRAVLGEVTTHSDPRVRQRTKHLVDSLGTRQ